MLYDADPDLEDLVIQELAGGKRLSMKALHGATVRAGKEVTLRALYKAVNQHVKNGVLLKVGTQVLLDQEWLQKVKNNLVSAVPELPPLRRGESLTYTFDSLPRVDAYWKTLVSQLVGAETGFPMFLYNAHDFWLYVSERKASEEAFYESFSKDGLRGFYVIGGDTELDRAFKRTYQSDFLQVDLRSIPALQRTDYMTILKDHIVTVRIPKIATQKIDALFEVCRDGTSMTAGIDALFSQRQKMRFRLEYNPVKARHLRRMLAKNFYISPELRKTCGV